MREPLATSTTVTFLTSRKIKKGLINYSTAKGLTMTRVLNETLDQLFSGKIKLKNTRRGRPKKCS